MPINKAGPLELPNIENVESHIPWRKWFPTNKGTDVSSFCIYRKKMKHVLY